MKEKLSLTSLHAIGVTIAMIAFWPTTATAFMLSTGQNIRCAVQTANGNYTVPEQSGVAGGFAGFTQMGPNGLPFITFDVSRFPQIGPNSGILADFLFYHECAHARFATRFTNQFQSELGANCEGLRKMRADGKINAEQELAVGQYHSIANVYSNLFGSGQRYWQMTLACASQPPAYAESVFGSGFAGTGLPGAPLGGTQLGPYCCTVTGARIGPFPPPHIPVGSLCQVPMNGLMVPGHACQ